MECYNSIKKSGLIPLIGEHSLAMHEPKPAIYLFPSYEDMETALGSWLGKFFEDDEVLVLLGVTIPKEIQIHHTIPYEICIYDSIPPENITFLNNL